MSANDFRSAMLTQLRERRRALAAESPERFAQIYLPNYCGLPFSRMHRELFAELAGLVKKRAGRLAVAAPRGHAKSTIVSLAFALWCVLYDKEKLVLLVSATREQAILLLKAVKDELQQNSLLLQDFPDICRPRGAPGQPKPWRDHRIQLPNGAMFSAYGAGQSLRGIKNKSSRPGLIIADDIEDAEHVISEEQRQKLDIWFNSTLLHAGHPGTNIVAVGTILHHDSLLANLVKPGVGRGWTGLKYRALEQPGDRQDLWEKWTAIFRAQEDYDGETGPAAAEAFFMANEADMLQGSRVLWPERDDYLTLMVTREREGRASFQAEKQNEPLDPAVCVFSEHNFQYWDDHFADFDALQAGVGREGIFVGACDPSLGRRTGRGDYTAIVILFRPERFKNNMYVVAADIARRTPDQAIEQILSYAKMYQFRAFAVEANNFQELMIADLRRRAQEAGVSLRVWPIQSRTNKQSRIAALEPEVTQGRVRLCRRHHALLDQLKQFPVGAHDDGPDALEMAVSTARRIRIPEGRREIAVLVPDWAQSDLMRSLKEQSMM